MAEANITVEVSVEAVLHDQLSKLARQAWELHGIRLNGVHFKWHEFLHVDRAPSLSLHGVEIDSETLC